MAVAGPVEEGAGHLTNRAWKFTSASLAKATGAPHVAIINDLQAQGWALDTLPPEALRTVVGTVTGHGTRLVVGVGTGFNVAPVYRECGRLLALPAEAGHMALPVADANQLALAEYLKGDDGFAALEDALSGRGLAHCFGFVNDRAPISSLPDGAEVMARYEKGDADATRAVQLFADIMASAIGNLALVYLPFGGIYLCGSVARAVASHFDRLNFADAYQSKGRFSGMVRNFGVAVIEDDFAALSGCAARLSQEL